MNSFWKDRPVFVTGCQGVLGSAVLDELLLHKARVVGLVRDYIPNSRLVLEDVQSKITSVCGSLEDKNLLERILNEFEIDTVFHLGAQTLVGTANRNPFSTFESNVRGTWNLCEASRSFSSVRRIIIASSDKAYGAQEPLPYSEEMPLLALNPYDVSKACADRIAASYAHSFQLPIAITRCGNIFGPGDFNKSRLVPGTIVSALRNQPLEIRSDGSMRRDYFYSKDAARAYLLLAEKLESRYFGEAFNFSAELPLRVTEMVEKILTLMNKAHLRPKILNTARNEIQDQYLSSAKARKILSWNSTYTLDEALQSTIKWYEQHFDEF